MRGRKILSQGKILPIVFMDISMIFFFQNPTLEGKHTLLGILINAKKYKLCIV